MSAPTYLVRHGQSEWNVQRLTQGQTSHPVLTDLGRQQAETAAALITADLKARKVDPPRIVSSDLVRARQTASIIGERIGVAVLTDPRLREQHLGSLEGKSYDETWAAADDHDWSDPTLPIAGGESLMDVYHRMAAVLTGVPDDQPTILVSHGDSIRAAIAHLHALLPHESSWVDVSNGSVARVAEDIVWLAQ